MREGKKKLTLNICLRTLTISALITSICTFLLSATYQDRLPSSYLLCAFYLVCMGASSAAAYICTLDSQVRCRI